MNRARILIAACQRTAAAVSLAAGVFIPMPSHAKAEFIPTLSIAPGTTGTLRIEDYWTSSPGGLTSHEAGSTITVSAAPGGREVELSLCRECAGLHAVRLGFEMDAVTILVKAEAKPIHRFVHRPAKGTSVSQVSVAGSFNNWDATATRLHGPFGDGRFESEVEMEPGRHLYKFVVDGNWITDPGNPESEADGFEGRNSIVEIAGSSGRGPRLVRVPGGARERARTLAFEPGESGKPIDPALVVAMVGNEPIGADSIRVKEGRITISLPDAGRGRHSVRVYARDTDGRLTDELGFEFVAGDAPPDWRDEFLYFAMTDRFCNGNPENDKPIDDPNLAPRANYLGGDWAGIRAKIEEGYFSRLGVTMLWVSPVIANAEGAWQDSEPPNRYYSSYHGYWPVAARETNHRFGTLDELKALVAAAHEKGIKVIVDVVANHVHEDHPYFREHPEWFGPLKLDDGTTNLRKFDEHPLTTWFDTFMPDLDYDKAPEALEAVVDDTIWWALECNLDGFRHDATKHVSHAFWRAVTRAVKTRIEEPLGRPFYQVGESIVGPVKLMEYVNPGELDGQFDFPLYWDMRDAFALETKGLDKLAEGVLRNGRVYGPWARNAAFVGNHDFARFMAYADGDLSTGDMVEEREIGWTKEFKVKSAASYGRIQNAFTFLMTLPQVPMVYYGDEIGMTGAGDPDNRRMMRFGEDVSKDEQAVAEHLAEVAKVRKARPALRDGDWTTLDAGEDHLVYLRSTFDDQVLCAFNRGDKAREIRVKLPEWSAGEGSIKPVVLFGDGGAEVSEGAVLVRIPGRSAVLVGLDR